MIKDQIRGKERSRDADDTLLAGWMYADLFLGLMVVFLATVTFIPEFLGGLNSSAANTSYKYREIYEKPFMAVYDRLDLELINSDIQRFRINEELSPDSVIIYAQIVGAYDKNSEDQSAAIIRAQKISQELDGSKFGFLKNASTTLSSTDSIPKNRFVLRFTFATEVGVQSSP